MLEGKWDLFGGLIIEQKIFFYRLNMIVFKEVVLNNVIL